MKESQGVLRPGPEAERYLLGHPFTKRKEEITSTAGQAWSRRGRKNTRRGKKSGGNLAHLLLAHERTKEI